MDTRNAPDWNDLRPFLALARAGSLAGAARAMGTRHSTVSRRIDMLEQALGMRLVHRTAAGAVLTEAGARLVPLAQAAERAVEAFVAAAAGVPRVWRLALPTGIAPLVAADLAALQARRPELAVEVLSSSRPADLAAGEADLAVRMRPVEDGDLVVRRVGEAGWSLYASTGYLAAHPVAGGDLSGHSLIGFHADLAGSPADRWLAEHGAGGRVVLRLGQMADLVATAREGIGVALLPCVLADAAEGLERLVPQVLLSQPVLLVCRRDVADDPQARVVIRCLVAALGRARAALSGVRG
ncbi:LysR family transcriptional regulator [Tabrizicola sp.]|uniref:LysR family transcriptional regulator n=1 Tax=Tabrizicola sp. TaxID=2005166 RepID=UPI003F313C13